MKPSGLNTLTSKGCAKKLARATTARSPLYTLPVIHDSSTDAVIVDSVAIAEYLNVTYLETPMLFPSGTETLQAAFIFAHGRTLSGIMDFVGPATLRILNPSSEAYYRATQFEPDEKQVAPEGEERIEKWANAKKGFDRFTKWLEKTEKPFIMGSMINFVDLVVGGYLFWIRAALGEESTEWADIKVWHGGRWVC